MLRNGEQAVAYFTNSQKVEMEAVYRVSDNFYVMTGKTLPTDRYNNSVKKYLAEKFSGERYRIEKMVQYEYSSKYRDPVDNKKPKPFYYVVVSQKIRGSRDRKFTRLEFNSSGQFMHQIAQPLDERDVQ